MIELQMYHAAPCRAWSAARDPRNCMRCQAESLVFVHELINALH